jgi:hypothetical protein
MVESWRGACLTAEIARRRGGGTTFSEAAAFNIVEPPYRLLIVYSSD